jgi:Helix-turn-helix domain
MRTRVHVKAQISSLLEAGLPRREVARRLDVSPSTVSRHARRLGESWRRSSTRLDGVAIRAYYEQGHSLRECRARFGFSNGAWNAAVTRRCHAQAGRSRQERTDARASQGAPRGGAQSGGHSARARRVGRDGISPRSSARRPRKTACARRYDWAAIQRFYDGGHSVRACQAVFGFSSKTCSDAVRRGDIVPRPTRAPLEQLLVSDGRASRTHLKQRLLAEGLKRRSRERCGISSWLGRPLSLCLHHSNGVPNDNRLEKARAPVSNCYSRTPNFAGRNVTR